MKFTERELEVLRLALWRLHSDASCRAEEASNYPLRFKKDSAEFYFKEAKDAYALMHKILDEAKSQPAVPDGKPLDGLYAVRYRDNWDGEGDICTVLARKDEGGNFIHDESGKPLIEYEGDELLQIWPLTLAAAKGE